MGNLVAMTTGLRLGEVIALRLSDIGQDRLTVRHSWSFADQLKAPKNGEERAVPLLPSVRDELLLLSNENPFSPDGFLFYHHTNPGRPCDGEVLRKGLHKALIDMTLSEDEQSDKKRREDAHKQFIKAGISFHSWRHFYATYMADVTDIRTVQLATGHKSAFMAEHYANHASEKHFDEISTIARTVFNNIVPFPLKGTG